MGPSLAPESIAIMGAACFKDQAQKEFSDVQAEGGNAGGRPPARELGSGVQSPFSGTTLPTSELPATSARPGAENSQANLTPSQGATASLAQGTSSNPPLPDHGSATSGEAPKIQPSGFQTMSPAKLATEVAQLSWIGHGGYGAVYKGIWQVR